MVASPLTPKERSANLYTIRVEKFIGPNGEVIELDVPLAKAALAHLGAVWGKAVLFGDLVNTVMSDAEEEGKKIENVEQQVDILAKVLLRLALSTSLVQLHIHQPTAFLELSEKPAITSLIRRQLESADNILTSLNIDIAIADPVSRKTLELLDGTRTVDEVASELSTFISNHRIEEIEKKKVFLRDLPTWLDDNLKKLASFGVFKRSD